MRENSEKFNWKGIEFPAKLKQILISLKSKIHIILLTSHGYDKDKGEVSPLKISNKQKWLYD